MKTLFVIGFWIFPVLASAFTLNSPTDPDMQGWDVSTLRFNLNPSNCPSNVVPLIKDSMDVWNGITTSRLRIELGREDSTTTIAQLTGGSANPADTPVIACDPAFGTTTHQDPNTIIGIGGAAERGRGGHLYYGYLLLNVQSGASGNIANFNHTLAKIIIAHEIGHVLGLGHSHDSAALMYYDASAKTNLALAQDDIDGITYLYPRDETSGDDLLGGCALVRSFPPRSGRPPWTGLAWMLLPVAAWIALWQRRRLRTARPLSTTL